MRLERETWPIHTQTVEDTGHELLSHTPARWLT